ncbi:MAG TPA: nuclear transport factor 2 family protein [Gaiellaceae bacterium]|nr:nuclear transport factor 2 family protein [Gaiellaceae bacterium]
MASETELVVAAVRDYFEGWYDSDVVRMERALHDDLVKRGPSLGLTTKARMLELTAQGEGAEDGVDRTLEIRVEDLYGTIANVTVESAVYQEYVQLVRTADGWKIVNTLWRPRHGDAPG